jgi:hypothetical protein
MEVPKRIASLSLLPSILLKISRIPIDGFSFYSIAPHTFVYCYMRMATSTHSDTVYSRVAGMRSR